MKEMREIGREGNRHWAGREVERSQVSGTELGKRGRNGKSRYGVFFFSVSV